MIAAEHAVRRADPERIVVVALPANAVPLSTALAGALDAACFTSPGGVELCGVGVAARIDATGPTRFADVERAGSALLARVEVRSPEPGAPKPRLVGGFSFAPSGDAWFVLPKICRVRESGRDWMCVALGADEPTASPRAPRVPRASGDFEATVARTVEHIRRGEFDKVVLARAVEEPTAIDAATLLERLSARHRQCASFGFLAEDAAFVGASPERLVQKQGLEVATEALAGTARAERPDALAGDKELSEHAIVRDAIARELSAVSSDVRFPEAPDVRCFGRIAHLWTPIRARLSEPAHVLDLVRRLHPTPAVGGAPRERALAWLAEHESLDRGWYAGPVGWFDAEGDGEFWVALRSALLAGGRARLYAGAGIVADSVPEDELAETELKLSAMREVLA